MDSDDRRVLLEFLRATNGSSWWRNDGWGTNDNISTWYGVEVDDEGRVVKLNLGGNNLKGEASSAGHTAAGEMANDNSCTFHSLHYVSEWGVFVAIVHGLSWNYRMYSSIVLILKKCSSLKVTQIHVRLL